MPVAADPQFVMLHVPYPAGVPGDLDEPIVRMLRQLDASSGAAPLAPIPDDERDGLLFSLTSTLTRALYHRRRFDELVQAAQVRWTTLDGHVVYDLIGKFILFEALALLLAARTTVDQVFYVAGRRLGRPPDESDELKPHLALHPNPKKSAPYTFDEARALQGPFRDWHEEMNAYRNVVGHQGWREQIHSFYPRGTPSAEALDPARNVMLVPDRRSVDARDRAHRWTYADGVRLEDLVARVGDGLLAFVEHVGRLWGGSIPAPGTMTGPAPNVMVRGQLVRVDVDDRGNETISPWGGEAPGGG